MVGSETEARDATLHEIIDWCKQEADKQYDLYRTTYGDERLSADAAEYAFEAVAEHCWEMLGQPTQHTQKGDNDGD